LELPQTLLEPVLLRYATQHGFPCRFNTRFLEFDEDPKNDRIVSRVQDGITKSVFEIKSKYLLGADGAKSKIVEQLKLPLVVKPSQGVALNVLVEADMSRLMKTRTGNLHYIMRPEVETPDFAWWAIARMVKPWHEWLFIFMYKPTCPPEFTPSSEDVAKQIREVIDDDSIPVDILRTDKWVIQETVAKAYSKSRV
jgi:2-polyprenyl-6-methoxyphenol hydroxylase-like FAD-dependent oxidoreductase